MSYKKLGDYIQQVNNRNRDLQVETLLGVSITKKLIPSIANTVGTDMSAYKIVEKGQFAYGTITSRNGDKISIALADEYDKALVSQIYIVFEVIDTNLLLPEYLMMWFSRPEFDRYARYHSHGSTREAFDWEDLCEVELPIPSIEKQREIVAQYQAVENKIKVNEQICEQLEATAQTLYKQWFVDFEFPNENGEPYKSSGGIMVFNEELEKEIPEGWEVGKLEDIIYYSDTKIALKNLTTDNYISTESMLPEKKGVEFISNVPEGNNVTVFEKGDILISNIRPYLKKIWFANKKGGCSNDVLCIRSKEIVYQFFALNILFNDQFFDYVMQGAKGTKMPRGDKDWILEYKILLPKKEILATFSKDIELVSRVKISKTIQNQKLTQLQSFLLNRLTRLEG
ncbi:hypothetical protein Pedsa_1278 [Pseudopedobacter saltans DSM 12145]|uniref:BAH domain-containing protein n=1 Tax=Pseudopedobacter saltans (strain ATCC 51119 / DSM 12145 / JCM 21818 / CCUG 39354 / LMG 10337 / NBRC 100064 / NCIMB 13643) TaxID=762903 RepID=F0SDU9_PSESL|nr:restriction endonuclease subunit S [Pseudopedobacter saltans]ADY51845.1 hypothetical protein Pedsa_1278 [Pseudopedobacter saltans DSM 12145]